MIYPLSVVWTNGPWFTRYVTFSELSFRKILLQATYGFFKMCNTKIIPVSDSHVKVTGMLVANLESRTEFDLGVAHALFDSRGDRVMHQSIPAAPRPPPPGWPPGISIFFALDDKCPGVGILELSNPLGWGRKMRANAPSSVNTATIFIDRPVEECHFKHFQAIFCFS